MSRFEFDSIKLSWRKVSSVEHDGIIENAFLSAGMTFPLFRDQNHIPGAVCVSALFEKDASLYILDLFRYEKYDFPLAEFFKNVYDKFKISEYAVPGKETQPPEMIRFFTEMEKRRYFGGDSVFPHLIPVKESSFQNFEPIFYLMPDHLYYRRSSGLNLNIGALDDTDFRSASDMPDLCALTVAAAFALSRAWQAFELTRIDKSQPKEKEDFF